MIRLPTLSFFFIFAAFLLINPVPGQARDAITTKLYGRALGDQDNDGFGQSVAASDTFLLVGQPGHDDAGDDAGAAQVFLAQSGRYLRTLLPGDEAPDDAAFGTAVAICDHLALIGAPGADGGKGAIYLFNLRTGRQLGKWSADDGVAGDALGSSVAFDAGLAVAGAPAADSDRGAVYTFDMPTGTQRNRIVSADGAAGDRFGCALSLAGSLLLGGAEGDDSERGAAYLFDAFTGTQILKIRAADGTAADHFGASLVLSGSLALVGAPDDDGAGAAYLFRIRTGAQLRKLTPTNRNAGDRFGESVALDTHLLAVGATGNDLRGSEAGAVHLFGTTSGTELRTLTAIDGGGFEHFGHSVALCGNRAIVGAINDGDLGPGSGSAYLVRPLAAPTPLATVVQFGDFAPGTIDADFRRILAPAINPTGLATFGGQLMGPGSNLGRDKGIWTTNASGGLRIATRSRTPVPVFGSGVAIRTPQTPVSEHSAQSLVPVLLTGSGITPRNQQALLGNDGLGLLPLLRSGDPLPALGDAELLRFLEILQTRDPEASRAAIPYLLRRGSGSPPVTPRNDTGVLVIGSDGTLVDSDAREGGNALDGLIHAQFFGRASTHSSDFMAFGGYVRPNGPGAAVQESFSASMIGPASASIARQGTDAPGLDPGQRFRTLLGETVGGSSFGLVRAIVAGPGINGSNNEGIWRETPERPLLRRGDELQPGVFVRRILRFWPVRDREFAAQLLLCGPGITGANEGALVLVQFDPDNFNPLIDSYSKLILLREGDSVPAASDCPRIRVIQRIEFDPESGYYAITAALTGSPGRNQALFYGNTALGNPTTRQSLRLPWLAVRKGDLYDVRASETSRLRSILLEPRIDRSGVGGKGLGQVLNPSGKLVVCLTYDDLGRELVTGTP